MKAVAILTAAVLAAIGIGITTVSALEPPVPVSIMIALQETRVAAGTPIMGEATVTNLTGRTIDVTTCGRSGWLLLTLTNSSSLVGRLGAAYELVQCRPTVLLREGVSSFPVRVSSDYPACLGNDPCDYHLRPLPAGTYTMSVLAWPPVRVWQFNRVDVTLTPSKTSSPPAASTTAS